MGAGRPEFSVSEVSDAFPLDISVVSRHLAVLREAGILDAERRGRQVLYQVREAWVAATFRRFAEVFETPFPKRPATTLLSVTPRHGERSNDLVPLPRSTARQDDAWRSW